MNVFLKLYKGSESRRFIFGCYHGGVYDNRLDLTDATRQRKTSSKLTYCPFKAKATYRKKTKFWTLKAKLFQITTMKSLNMLLGTRQQEDWQRWRKRLSEIWPKLGWQLTNPDSLEVHNRQPTNKSKRNFEWEGSCKERIPQWENPSTSTLWFDFVWWIYF